MLKIIAELRRRVCALRIRCWARARFRRNDAVILDTETTDLDGDVIQLSVIDLHGSTLLSTLIRPMSPISAAAGSVHGITDADVAAAPGMAEIAPQLKAVTRNKWVLAYNAPFDRAALVRSLELAQVAPGWLAAPKHWRCLMRLRAATENGRWTKLDGPHHALGDCLAALQVLHRMAGPSIRLPDLTRSEVATPHLVGERW